MHDDLFLIFVGYSVFFGALAALLLWTLRAQRTLRATLSKLQGEMGEGDTE